MADTGRSEEIIEPVVEYTGDHLSKDGNSSTSDDSPNISKCSCLRGCLQSNCHEFIECGGCVIDCTGELHEWCRHVELRRWLRRTFTVENAKNKLPITKWLPRYRLKHFQGDIVAGLTVGLTILPQSLAYASLAKLPPQYGLYTSFMCSYVYMFFGTAKDLSIGPAAVMSLLTGEFAHSPIPGDATYAIVLSLMCGVVQVLMSIFHLGFIVDYFSQPVIQSFTTASVITIIFSQIPKWFGLQDIPSNFLEQVYWICRKLPETRWQDFLLGAISMIILFLMKKMREINCFKIKDGKMTKKQARLKYLIWLLSISRNAIVVIAAGGAVAIFKIYDMTPFSLPNSLPPGLPPFKPPAFSVTDGNTTYTTSDIFSKIGGGFIAVPLIGLVEAVAIAKAFGRRYQYNVIPNQELLALGISNILGSFVSAYPVTASFSRSSINAQSGVKTPAGGFVTATLVVLVIAFLTPLFDYIPNAALAAVIIMAVSDMTEFHAIVEMWKSKRLDLLAWFGTFIFSLCFSIEVGLLVGLVISVCFIIYPPARPGIQSVEGFNLETKAEGTNADCVVVYLDQGLVFPSVEYFKKRILELASSDFSESASVYRSVVVDCSYVSDIDYTVIEGLQQLFDDFSVMKVNLILCKLRPKIHSILIKSSLRHSQYMATVQDAVALIQSKTNEPTSVEHRTLLAIDSDKSLNDIRITDGFPITHNEDKLPDADTQLVDNDSIQF